MKRQPLILALALLFVVGAALWGVNYRLDHPPLTEADKEFRVLVAGADSVRGSQMICQNSACDENWRIKYEPLNAAQTRELIETLRFAKAQKRVISLAPNPVVRLDLAFTKNNKTLLACTLIQNSSQSALNYFTSTTQFYPRLAPRSQKRLNRALDAYFPQRLRP